MENKIKIVDVSSGEEFDREMTQEELLNHEADLEALEQHEIEKKAQEETKKSAIEKLSALGLSAEEIAAITGA